MKINWKVRLKNKTFLLTLAAVVITFVYQILSLMGISPKTDSETILEAIKTVLILLTSLGVIIDPTTEGVSDSERAQSYIELGGKEIQNGNKEE